MIAGFDLAEQKQIVYMGLGCGDNSSCGCKGMGEGTPTPTPTQPGNWWQGLIETAVKTTGSILTNRYGAIQEGVYQQTPNGLTYRVPAGSPNVGFNTLTPPVAGDMSSLLFYGGLGLFGLLALKALKK